MIPRWLPVAAVLVLACGSPQAAPGPSAGGEEPAPTSGGVLTVSENIDYTNMDPTTSNRSEGHHNSGRAYDGLLRFGSGAEVRDDNLALEPALAERWEASSDGKRFTFHLKKGIRFAELPPVNGRELTSADVRWTLEYISRTGPFKDAKLGPSLITFKVDGLEGVDTPDPYTAVVRFKEPFAPFLNYAGTAEIGMLPREIYEQDGHLKDRTAGTGPWQYDPAASQAGTRLVFKKNKSYWEPGMPYLDEVRTLTIPEDSTAFAAFQTKQLDLVYDIDVPIDADSVRRANPSAIESKYLGDGPWRLYYNVERAPFNDVKFRTAVSRAIDREEFVRLSTAGKGQWAAAGTGAGVFTPEELRKMFPYNPEEARRLLREGGYPEGFQIEFLGTNGYGAQFVSDSELLQSQLKKAGIDMVIKLVDRVDSSNRRRTGDYTISATSPSAGNEPDFDRQIYGYFHSTSSQNHYRVKDPKLDELAQTTRYEADPAKRREALRRAVQYIADQSWGIWVYHAPGFRFWHPHVKGYYPTIANRSNPLAMTWLDR